MRVLDLFSGQGGVGAGYVRAGHDVLGVDINPNCGKYYPSEFVTADAWEFVEKNWRAFDVVHFSTVPPAYTEYVGGLF